MRILIKAFFLITLFIFSLTLAPGVHAATYYVSSGGSDTNSGTLASPWLTIQKAADTMVAGDTTNVNAGDYGGDVTVFKKVRITKSGSSGLPIIFQASGTVLTQGFLVSADYIIIKGFDVEDPHDDRIKNSTEPDYRGGTGIYVEGSNNIIEDNYVHDSVWSGIILAKNGNSLLPQNSIVRNNRIFRNGISGMQVSGRNNLIEGNEIWATIQHHPGNILSANATWLDADGIRFFGQGHTFRKNYIHDIKLGYMLNGVNVNIDPHIDCFQTWGGTAEAASNIIFEQNYCKNLTQNMSVFMLADGTNHLYIRNNIFESYTGINSGGGADYLYIYNNIFMSDLSFKPDPSAIGLAKVTHSIIKNNIFYNQPSHTVLAIGSTSGNEVDYNLAYNSNGTIPECVKWGNFDTCQPSPNHELWNVNPQFVDPVNGDFHLKLNSPAIDRGADLSSSNLINDYDGVSRPRGAGYDIGAYEFALVATPTDTPVAGGKLGDLNSDGKVDFYDYNIFVGDYGKTGVGGFVASDIDKNGKVDFYDYNIFVGNYGK